ncbi:hypothetical protein ACET3Z_020950 [Daucus carota]
MGVFFENPLPNGNRSGIELVVRNGRGKILRMIAGSLEFVHRRLNEYQALLEGCKCVFLKDWKYFDLECDHLDSFWEWKNSTLEGVHPEHAPIVQQLNQRQADRNFVMEDLHPVVDNEVDVPVVEDGPHAEAAQNGDDEEMVEIIEIADD